MLFPNQTIRYTTGPLGVTGDREALVNEGDLGRYLGPMENEDDWVLTEPAKYPGKVCPVTTAMIEAVA